MATSCKPLVHFPAIKYTFDDHVPFINGIQTPLSGCYCYSISAASHKLRLYHRTLSQRSHTFATLVAFTKLLFISPLRLLFQFSFHGQEQGFSKSHRISCLLHIKVEKEKRGQLENSRAVVRAQQRNVHVLAERHQL